ncbi:hypothetical protein PN36_30440 [Candidatus Thiomargarita nelsonii]|uniref:Transmembrane protein n=1 Tax=Candidatus Thiomargarita nelsonii TaxID=1003181 RepID=A0A0A6PDV7_9GAMM|nr:hypothetical protein PN36_30440 [Candidatus Thiomargarita nelsonii]
MLIDMLKFSAFGFLFVICLSFVSWFVPFWLIAIIFFIFMFFVLVPIFLGIGTLGRKFGNNINEAAIEEDRKNREKYAKKS